MDWEDYRVFLTVLRKGSYAAAAPALDMVAATARRHVERLEAGMGEALFTGKGRDLAPTHAALALRPVAESMERAARGFTEAALAERDDPRGLVRVRTPEVIGENVVTPTVARLRVSHPDIRIETAYTNGPLAFDAEAADIAIMLAPPNPAGLWVEDVGEFRFGLFGRRDLLDRVGRPESLADLRRLPLVGSESEASSRLLFSHLRIPFSDRAYKVRTDNFAGQFIAITQGLGLGVCQVALAARHDELERLLPEFTVTSRLFVVLHQSQAAISRMRVVQAALLQALKAFIGPDAAAPAATPPKAA